MASISKTIEHAIHRDRTVGSKPAPGLLLVFSDDEPLFSPIELDGGAVELGRGKVRDVTIQDGCMSRRHAKVSYDGEKWTIEDLGSRNGTQLDGERVTGEVTSVAPRVLRCGDSVFLPLADLRPFLNQRVDVREKLLMGPTLRTAWDAIKRAATHGDVLHVTGESGSGKELAARAFHENSPRAEGAFIAVNCAAIPEAVAERLLFGAKKGAYSGADADADGYVQAANGGTLFLDEIGELPLPVQAKLLRVLESREVLPLGSTRPKAVELNILSATHRGLREEVASKRFREDLYFRVGRPEVALPPLRERREEIAYFVDRELRKVGPGLVPTASLVEAVMLRPWPGNVRELLAELRDAGRAALAANEKLVTATYLAAGAGKALVTPPAAPVALAETSPGGGGRISSASLPAREEIEAVLRREGGRVATAARALGVHRTQLRRYLTKHNIDPRQFGSTDDGGEGDAEG